MQVVLGLGGNLGDREANLRQALALLAALPDTQLLRCSSFYETEPFDVRSAQPDYLNCCAVLETALAPETLLERCLGIEAALGRVRKEYHGARTVDIDVLLCEGFHSRTKRLTVPHPRIRERAFVLVPLRELFPTGEALGFPFLEAWRAVDRNGVRPWNSGTGEEEGR